MRPSGHKIVRKTVGITERMTILRPSNGALSQVKEAPNHVSFAKTLSEEKNKMSEFSLYQKKIDKKLHITSP